MLSLRARLFAAAVMLLAVTGCGGRTLTVPSPVPSGGAAATQTALITFVVQIPQQATAASRKPLYVSPSTRVIVATVTPAGGGPTTTVPNACAPSQCTVPIPAPIGLDNFSISLYDAGQVNLLSTGSTTQVIVAGQTNTVKVTFGGVIAQIVLSPNTFTFADGISTSDPIAVNALDADGNTIVAPGAYTSPIALSSGDKSGAITIAPASITGPGSTATIAYSGSTSVTGTVTISATASGAPATNVPASISNGPFVYFAAGLLNDIFCCQIQATTYVAPLIGGQLGTFSTLLASAGPMAVAPDGTLYQSIWSNGSFGFQPTTTITTTARPPAHGNGRSFTVPSAPNSIAADGAGNVYVAMASGVSVYSANASGSAPTPIRQLLTVLSGIALDQNGALYGVAFAPNTYVNPCTGFPQWSAIRVFAPNASGISFPVRSILPLPGYAFWTALAEDNQTNLYVAGSIGSAAAIFVYPSGASGMVAPSRIITGNQIGCDMATDAMGDIFTSDVVGYSSSASGSAAPYTSARAQTSLNEALQFLAIDNIQPTPAPPSGSPTPSATLTQYQTPGTAEFGAGMAAGPDGNIWFAEYSGPAIAMVTTASNPGGPGIVTTYPLVRGAAPYGITAGSDGALWFTEEGANAIGRITTSGTITSYALPTSSERPTWATLGADGNVWFIENTGVGRITPSGAVSQFASNAGRGSGIVSGPDGNLYVPSSVPAQGSIYQITTSGVSTLFASLNPVVLGAIAVGPDNNLWIPATGGTGGTNGFSYPFLVRVTTKGTVTEYPAIYTNGSNIVSGPNGYLYVVGPSGIAVVNTNGVDLLDIPIGASAVVQGPDGNLWFGSGSAAADYISMLHFH